MQRNVRENEMKYGIYDMADIASGVCQTPVNTDSTENRWRPVCGWTALFEDDFASLFGKRVPIILRECFLSLRAKEVMMCGDPFCFFR